MAEQPADGLQGLNDVDAFARILATKFQKPQPDLQGREVHMPEDQENRIMRQVHASVIQNPEGMSRAIVDAVRRGNSSEYVHEMALQHAKDPFYTDDIVIFKGDGLTVLTESIPPADELQDQENEAMMDNSFNEDGTVPPESIQPAAVAGGRIPTQNEGSAGVGARIPTREDQEAEVTMESEWPDPQGLDALPKIAVDPPGYFRVYVVYAGEQVGISSQLMVFKVGGGTPFGELMASYEDAIQLSCDAKLEYYHGPSQITEEDTLDVLADDEIIILDQDNDFVLHTYDVDDLLDDKNSNDNNAVGEEEINEDPDGGKHNQRDDEENVAERHNFEEEDEDEEEDEGKDKEKGDDKEEASDDSFPSPESTDKEEEALCQESEEEAPAKSGAAVLGKSAESRVTNRAPRSAHGKKDNRTGRGNRKRTAKSPPTSLKHQMDSNIRQHLDSSAGPIEKAQAMCTPRCFMDGYDADADSDTSSVADQRGWPRVIIGQFMYTEQRPNANGGGDTRRFKKPRIYFNTGSQKNRDYFGEKLTKVIEGKKGGVDLSFHETFESFKEAAFDHPSIAQPQINKAKRRYQQNQKKLKRQQNHKK